MSNQVEASTPSRLLLAADTARDLMEFLTNKGFSAAPVIDDAGRPIGP